MTSALRSQGGEIRVAKCKVDQQCNVFKNPQMLKLRSMEAPESDRARFTVGVADDIEPVLIKEDTGWPICFRKEIC